jgi:hypothetical protein
MEQQQRLPCLVESTALLEWISCATVSDHLLSELAPTQVQRQSTYFFRWRKKKKNSTVVAVGMSKWNESNGPSYLLTKQKEPEEQRQLGYQELMDCQSLAESRSMCESSVKVQHRSKIYEAAAILDDCPF